MSTPKKSDMLREFLAALGCTDAIFDDEHGAVVVASVPRHSGSGPVVVRRFDDLEDALVGVDDEEF